MKKEVDQSVVENFLASLDKRMDVYIHFANARDDARSYQWNMPTLNAVMKAIFKSYNTK